MFPHVQKMINEIVPDEPDPAAANALQEGLGGQFGEMRTMLQYLSRAFNFRGAAAKPYRDLLYGVGTEEIGHAELIATTIARLTDGSPKYNGDPPEPLDVPGGGGRTPLSSALSAGNIHHYLEGPEEGPGEEGRGEVGLSGRRTRPAADRASAPGTCGAPSPGATCC